MTLNINEPYEKLGPDPVNPDWVRQNGVLYYWSESNCMYEQAWWLDESVPSSSLVDHLRATRQPPKE